MHTSARTLTLTLGSSLLALILFVLTIRCSYRATHIYPIEDKKKEGALTPSKKATYLTKTHAGKSLSYTNYISQMKEELNQRPQE